MKKLITTVILAGSMFVGYAQSFTLRGTVMDEENKPLKGVTVYVKETGKNEIFTNADGHFRMLLGDTAKQKTIVFALPSYKSVEYPVNLNENDIRIVLTKGEEIPESASDRDTRIRGSATATEAGITTLEIVTDEVVVEAEYSTREERETTTSVTRKVERDAVELEGTLFMRVEDDRRVERSESVSLSTAVVADREIAESETPPAYPHQSNIQAGLLTSGEVNDFAKWHLWGDILQNDFRQFTDRWHFFPIHRYIAQLTNKQGMPLSNALVTLKAGNGEILWQAKTDNTGKAELWIDFFKSGDQKTDVTNLKMVFEYEGKNTELTSVTPFEQGINTAQIETACKERNRVDMFFMVDATGSMGDEIRYLQAELDDIIRKIYEQHPELQLRVGSLVYRDHGDTYLTRKSSLSSDINETLEFLQAQSAGGGGDYPEAVDIALEQSILNEEWDDDALARILFIVLDAPSHTNPEALARLQSQLRLAAKMGIRIVPIACSDIQKDGEYLMRTFALATNGTYLFLTDHSGIGNPHLEPTTDQYEVEKFNDALVRIIKQYTKMPDCNNPEWAEENKNAEPSDKFVPNPYDEQRGRDAERLTVSDIIILYPNPCSDILRIDIKKSDVKDVYIVDMTGKTLYGVNTPARTVVEIDVSRLSTSVYFVKAFYNGRWYTEKFIKR